MIDEALFLMGVFVFIASAMMFIAGVIDIYERYKKEVEVANESDK